MVYEYIFLYNIFTHSMSVKHVDEASTHAQLYRTVFFRENYTPSWVSTRATRIA